MKNKQSLFLRNKASVIIPNWNGAELLKDCLTSLNQQTFADFEIILVDNGSTDNSLAYIENNFPFIKIIKLKKNFGFAKAINEGVKASRANYVVFLNNDTKVEENWLKNLVECAEKHTEVISVNSKLLNFDNPKLIDGVGILINEAGQARSIGYQEKDEGQYNKEAYIFGATGGGSLFVRSDFIKVGCFDENFFLYSEEVDFAFRAQFQGYKSIYCPKAKVFHKHKATSGNFPGRIEYWQFRNMTQTIIKDFPAKILFRNWRWLKIILVHLNTFVYQLKKGFLWSPFLAMLWILFHLPLLCRERRKIQSKIKADLSYIENFLIEKKVTFWGLWK